ncbi:Uncharacterized protein TCM_015591 [Theobroma cacao]|uniref:Uncharacterized protein n=1 Tax=Theobroma cacao TaxID=3641 RepID=A0A061G1U3_THECC|nr:Uncharacterized protein TCM_015591 [Theobroma cacao]
MIILTLKAFSQILDMTRPQEMHYFLRAIQSLVFYFLYLSLNESHNLFRQNFYSAENWFLNHDAMLISTSRDRGVKRMPHQTVVYISNNLQQPAQALLVCIQQAFIIGLS